MGRGRGGTGLVILTMTLVLLIDSLDASIVQVALPEMSLDLGMSVTDGAFVVVAYLFPLAGLCIPLSRLASDGRVRPMLVMGTVVFTAASVGCAMSGDRGVLIAFRFVQGLGAAMMVSATPAMCTSMLPLERRHMGMAYMNAACCVAIILGPALGGLITGLSEWHWIFLINVPVGIIVVTLALRIREVSPSSMSGMPEPARAAAMFVAVATGMVVLELWTGGLFAWYTAVLAAICVLSMAAFLALGRRGTGGERLIDIPLRGNGRYYAITVLFLVNSIIGCGVMYLLPYYLTGSAGRGSSAIGRHDGLGGVLHTSRQMVPRVRLRPAVERLASDEGGLLRDARGHRAVHGPGVPSDAAGAHGRVLRHRRHRAADQDADPRRGGPEAILGRRGALHELHRHRSGRGCLRVALQGGVPGRDGV